MNFELIEHALPMLLVGRGLPLKSLPSAWP